MGSSGDEPINYILSSGVAGEGNLMLILLLPEGAQIIDPKHPRWGLLRTAAVSGASVQEVRDILAGDEQQGHDVFVEPAEIASQAGIDQWDF